MGSLRQLIKTITYKKFSGYSLVELLMAIGLASLLIPTLATSFITSREGKAQEKQRLQATTLFKEAQEAVRNIREAGWNNIATNGTYHATISGSMWTLVPSEEVIDGFTRRIIIDDVRRDSAGNIVSSGGTIDPSTKSVTVNVSWTQPSANAITATSFLTRFQNDATIQTSTTDFQNGTRVSVDVTNDSGGEVTLGAGSGSGSNWCSPNLSITAYDLPKNGVANAIAAIQGKAFAGTGDNSSGVSYASVNITDTNPPVVTPDGTFNGYKTNGIFGEENYAYVTTDDNGKEVVIIDISGTTFTEVGYFNIPGNSDGMSVYVAGNIGFVTSGTRLYSFNLSSKNGSRSQIDSVNLAGSGTRVVVKNGYAFVSIAGASIEMQIIQVAANGDLSNVIAQADVNGQAARDVFVNDTGTRAYLATDASSTQREMFIVNTTNKSGTLPVIGPGYEASGMSPKGITVVTGNRAILVGSGGEEYQAISIATETVPIRCGGLQVNTGVNGVASVLEGDGDAYSYIITGDTSTEFKIIQGGNGGSIFLNTGTFTSSTMDTGSTVLFNRFSVTLNRPPQTDISFQIAVANAVNNSCTGVPLTFIGPDGTTATRYQTAVTSGQQVFNFVFPQSLQNGRCVAYRAELSTTDHTQAPILYDAAVNYSL
jgi:type II secretory pathway pseudopilin PulG